MTTDPVEYIAPPLVTESEWVLLLTFILTMYLVYLYQVQRKKNAVHKCDCGKMATFLYGPDTDDNNPFQCYDCVSKGCSCNNESFYDGEDAYDTLEVQAQKQLEQLGRFYLIDYGKRQMCSGKEIRTIKDSKEIEAALADTASLMHYIIVPFDENGNEYTCCEYFEDPNGFRIQEDEL